MIYLTWTTLVIILLVLLCAFFYYQLIVKSKKLQKEKDDNFNKITNLKMNSEKKLKEISNSYDNQLKQIQDNQEQELSELEELSIQYKKNLDEKYNDQFIKLNSQQEIYQKYIIGISNTIKLTDSKLKELDVKGTFESDDEIGFFFKSVKEIQSLLNSFQVELIVENNKETE